MRSGSKLLCELLSRAENLGFPQEFLNPRLLASYALLKPAPPFLRTNGIKKKLFERLGGSSSIMRRSVNVKHVSVPFAAEIDIDQYLDFLRTNRCSANGVFSCNAHVDHLIYLQQAGIDFRTLGFNKIVYLSRQDRIAQSGSLAMGLKYDFWTSTVVDHRPKDASVSRSEVLRAMAYLEEWSDWIEQQVRPLIDVEIFYEDLVKDTTVADRLPNLLGIDEPTKDISKSVSLEATTARSASSTVKSMRVFLKKMTEWRDE